MKMTSEDRKLQRREGQALGHPNIQIKRSQYVESEKRGSQSGLHCISNVECWDYKASGALSALITGVYSSEWLQMEDGEGVGESG